MADFKVLQETPAGYLVQSPDGRTMVWPQQIVQANQDAFGQLPTGATAPVPEVPAGVPDLGAGQPIPLATAEPIAPEYAQPPPEQAPAVPEQTPFLPPELAKHGRTVEVQRRGPTGAPPSIDYGPLYEAGARSQAETNQAYQDAANAAAAKAQVDTEIAQAQQPIRERAVAEDTDLDRMLTQSKAMNDAKLAADDARINEAIAQIPQTDPNRWWHQQDGLHRAMNVVAAALGGALAVSTGSGRNMAMDFIDKQIDNDIRAQQMDQENARAKAAYAGQAYERHANKFAADQAFYHEQHAYRLESIAHALEVEAGKYASPSKQAELMGIAADLRLKRAQSAEDALKQRAQMYETETGQRINLYQTQQEARLKWAELAQRKVEASAKELKVTPYLIHPETGRPMLLDQNRAAAMRPDDYANFDKETTGAYDFRKVLWEAGEAYAKVAGKYAGPGQKLVGLGSDDKARLQSIRLMLTDRVNAMQADHRMSDEDAKRIQQQIGDPEGWTTINQYGNLQEMGKIVGHKMQTQGRVLGLHDSETHQPINFLQDFNLPDQDTWSGPKLPSDLQGQLQHVEQVGKGLRASAKVNPDQGKASYDEMLTMAMAAQDRFNDHFTEEPGATDRFVGTMTQAAVDAKATGHDPLPFLRMAAQAKQTAKARSAMGEAYRAARPDWLREQDQTGTGLTGQTPLFDQPVDPYHEPQQFTPERYTPRGQ